MSGFRRVRVTVPGRLTGGRFRVRRSVHGRLAALVALAESVLHAAAGDSPHHKFRRTRKSLWSRRPGSPRRPATRAPRLIHADTVIRGPTRGTTPRIATSSPRITYTQLLLHWVSGHQECWRVRRDRMVVHELSIGLGAKSLIPHGAQDQAVPGLIHRARRHPDHLFVRAVPPRSSAATAANQSR